MNIEILKRSVMGEGEGEGDNNRSANDLQKKSGGSFEISDKEGKKSYDEFFQEDRMGGQRKSLLESLKESNYNDKNSKENLH
jgi:hypothetical protein